MRSLYPVMILSLLPLLAGCAAEAPYHVVVKNTTPTELSSVTIRFGSFRFEFGVLDPGIFASYMFTNEREPLPKTVELSWTADDGQTVVQKLSVKSKAPAKYSNLYVTFLITSATTAAVQFEDKKRE